jgi:hypothetical protein
MKAFFRFCLVFFGRGARGSVQLDDAVTHCLGTGRAMLMAARSSQDFACY